MEIQRRRFKGHRNRETGNIIQFPNRKVGILFVGIFLMISGYGLMYGLENKEDYLKNFWPKRLGKMIPIFAIVVIIDFIINKEINFSRATGGAKWYVYELIILYILFYISNRLFIKNQLAIFFFGRYSAGFSFLVI
jgi:membrane-bound acyltransferase YfiQ involved in biofilm formation